ncbi:MAG: hypothetical protein ACK5XN_03820 [Bacteroidota bacterium]|jgi:hypothetical protein
MATHHILVVSKELIPLYKGMKHFPADRFYFFGSADSKPYVDTLKKLWKSEGGGGILIDGYWDIPPFDAPAVADVVAGLIKTIPREDTVYINLTGGTKPMSWGVMKAVGLLAEYPDKPEAKTALPAIRAFYFTAGDKLISLPDLNISEPADVKLKTAEFLSLSGTMSFAIGSNAPEEYLLTSTLKIISMFRSFPGIRNRLKEISDNKRAEGEISCKVR